MKSVPVIAFYRKQLRNLSAKALVQYALYLLVSAAVLWPFWGMTPYCTSAGKWVDSSGNPFDFS